MFLQPSYLRIRSPKSSVGTALSDMRQGPLLDVSAAFVQRLEFRQARHKTFYICSLTSESSLRVGLVRSLFGCGDSGNRGFIDRLLSMIWVNFGESTFKFSFSTII